MQTSPPFPWNELNNEEWSSWRWQLSNQLKTSEELARIIQLTDSEKIALQKQNIPRAAVTPYFASLIDPDDPECPIRRQVIPTEAELLQDPSLMDDSLGEDKHSPVPGLVHRYPDRVLMLVTTQCASYCRFCTRNRLVGKTELNFGPHDFERQIEYIENTPQIRDVLLSGGDPLILPRKTLGKVLKRLHSIPHVEIVRIGSRIPIYLPQRITDDYVEFLKQFQPLWLNIHVNHPKELTPEVEIALGKMADAGIVLGNQSVLLAGINDCPNIIRDLMRKLVINRVRPYYLYQCDLVKGAGHFRTPVATGIEIIESLRGHTSGYSVPTFVVDIPSGGGKVPLGPNYFLGTSDEKVVLRNYEGYIGTYTQPLDYEPHHSETCSYCINSKKIGKQEGIFGLQQENPTKKIDPRIGLETTNSNYVIG